MSALHYTRGRQGFGASEMVMHKGAARAAGVPAAPRMCLYRLG
jgi:hypothetical protein